VGPKTSAEVEAELARQNRLIEARGDALERRLQQVQRAHKRRETRQLQQNVQLLAELGHVARGHRETVRALDTAVAQLSELRLAAEERQQARGSSRPVGRQTAAATAAAVDHGALFTVSTPLAAKVVTASATAPGLQLQPQGVQQPRSPPASGGGHLAPPGLGKAVAAIVQVERTRVAALSAALQQSARVVQEQTGQIERLKLLVRQQQEEGQELVQQLADEFTAAVTMQGRSDALVGATADDGADREMLQRPSTAASAGHHRPA